MGKVGTESPTFIEPLSERRDGIQAMFAKQPQHLASQGSSTKRKLDLTSSTPLKKPRKGTSHEIVDLCDDDGDDKPLEKMNSWEDDSEIDYVNSSKGSASSTVSCYVLR